METFENGNELMVLGKFRPEQILRKVHSWLGIFILPWVVVIGLTGLYLNHSKLVIGMLPFAQRASLSQIDNWQNRVASTPETTREIARSLWPAAQFGDVVEERYRKQKVYT